jgi:hypothetical protein
LRRLHQCRAGSIDAPDQVVISAQNRNFPGRSGPGQMYLASPLTVAASAVAGYIVAYEPQSALCGIAKNAMKILLYNPDNGVTRNFMPHLWMFLLQALTPPGHEVLLVDGNASPWTKRGSRSLCATTILDWSASAP